MMNDMAANQKSAPAPAPGTLRGISSALRKCETKGRDLLSLEQETRQLLFDREEGLKQKDEADKSRVDVELMTLPEIERRLHELAGLLEIVESVHSGMRIELGMPCDRPDEEAPGVMTRLR